MNTLTATTSSIETESFLRRKARAFFAELRLALEFIGKAHSHGMPPL